MTHLGRTVAYPDNKKINANMRSLNLFLLFPLMISCQLVKTDRDNYYLPAEWKPHQGMIISFLSSTKELKDDSVSVEMVKALSLNMKVYCMILADSLIPSYKKWFKKEGIVMDSVQFIFFGGSFP